MDEGIEALEAHNLPGVHIWESIKLMLESVSLIVNNIALPDLAGFPWTANLPGILIFLTKFKKTDLLRDSGRRSSYLRGPAGRQELGVSSDAVAFQWGSLEAKIKDRI